MSGSYLMIANTSIRRDAKGRYSLNDLHKASGGEQRHRPKYWLENQQTIALVDLLSKGGIPPLVSNHGGVDPGTYVKEQLVVAYAAWISPAFHLEVINTFLAVKKAQSSKQGNANIAPSIAREYRGLLSIAKTTGLKGNMAILAAAQGTERLTGTNPLALIGQTHLINEEQERYATPTELGQRHFSESGQAFNKRLMQAGFQAKPAGGSWTATAAGQRYAKLMDTTRRHSDGSPVLQLKWLDSVVEHLQARMAA